MALYVAVCLIAALTALENVTAVPGDILGLVWGTTVGLALAHVFAFRVAGRLVHDGVLPKADRIVSVVQLVGAAAVAVVVSVPVLLASTEQRTRLGRLRLRRHHRCGRLSDSHAAPSMAGYAPCCSASESLQSPPPSPYSNTAGGLTRNQLLQAQMRGLPTWPSRNPWRVRAGR